MTPGRRVMLLIDADNVSADVVEQAVAKVMAEHGAIHVRRAYCTAESALANLKLFKSHSIRPIVNLSTGKNSTDIALAVDAVDLVITERPEVVVIVSSDSDFAPLVIKLREKGCRVEGIGQQGKTGDDSKPVYDDFTDLAHRRPRQAPADGGPAATARKRAVRRAGAAPAAPVVVAAAAPAGQAEAVATPLQPSRDVQAAPVQPRGRTPRPRKTPQRAEAAAGEVVAASPTPSTPPMPPIPSIPPMPDDLRRILAVLPELARGATLELGIAAERLRSESLLAKNATSTRLFRKYPDWFVLSPERQPNKVQYRGAATKPG